MPRLFSTWATLAFVPLAVASEPARPADLRLYELTIETSMPHLEENLRYTTLELQRCLTSEQLVRVFPVLEEDPFRNCRLQLEQTSSDEAMYRLQCSKSSGTTGAAAWSFGEPRSRGTLRVKLGGKNMTFFQRVSARELGACGVEEKISR